MFVHSRQPYRRTLDRPIFEKHGTGASVPRTEARAQAHDVNPVNAYSIPRAASPASFRPGRPRAKRAPKAGHIRDLTRGLDAVRICLYGQVVIAISQIHVYLGAVGRLRPALVLAVLGLSAVFLKPSLIDASNLTRSWASKAVIGLVILSLGGVVFGLSAGSSAAYIIDTWSKNLVFFFLLVVGLRSAKDISLMVWAFVISVGVVILLGFTVLDLEPTATGLGRIEGNGGFDANDQGMIFVMALPLAVLLSYNSGRIGRIISGAVIVLVPMGIALTGSRGAMVGLVASSPFLFFSLSRISLAHRLGGIGVLVGGLLVAAPSGYWQQMETILDSEEDYNRTSDYGRVAIAKRGFGYMMGRPIFGLGINNFRRAEGEISPIMREREAAGLAVRWIAPHNTYVQVGAELGVFALAIWLGMIYGSTVGLWRLRRRIPVVWECQTPERKFLRELCLLLPTAVIAFAVTSFFLTHAYSPPGYILFALAGALHLFVRRELAYDRLSHERRAVQGLQRQRAPLVRARG